MKDAKTWSTCVKFLLRLLFDLHRYASSWSLVSPDGSMVGIPGMNVLSSSPPPQRDFLFLFLSEDPLPLSCCWSRRDLRVSDGGGGGGGLCMFIGACGIGGCCISGGAGAGIPLAALFLACSALKAMIFCSAARFLSSLSASPNAPRPPPPSAGGAPPPSGGASPPPPPPESNDEKPLNDF